MSLVMWYTLENGVPTMVRFDCGAHFGSGIEVVQDDPSGHISIVCAKHGCPLADFQSKEEMLTTLKKSVLRGEALVEPELRKRTKDQGKK